MRGAARVVDRRRAVNDGYARRTSRCRRCSAGRDGMTDDYTPADDWETASPDGLAGPHRHHAGLAPQANRLRRPARLHRHLFPGVRAAQGHAREQVRDPGLGRPEGDRPPRRQVRRAQRRDPAGRLRRRERQARHAGARARRSQRALAQRRQGGVRDRRHAARSPTTTSGSRRPIRASATPRCSSRRTASSSTRAKIVKLEDDDEGDARQGRHQRRVHG